jgi:hypothetical protein
MAYFHTYFWLGWCLALKIPPIFLSHDNLAFWRHRFLTDTGIHFRHAQSTTTVEERYYRKVLYWLGTQWVDLLQELQLFIENLGKVLLRQYSLFQALIGKLLCWAFPTFTVFFGKGRKILAFCRYSLHVCIVLLWK